ncbi:hypothetical protein H5410_046204 [Solanum commersonii]|uniref:Uncharacterized protein n=1 Tax=Solanum commersonii TaxID=4109 RepID=A0A9J5XDI6_SOLCO|nr:hypothetical protein H5410_046204 [Solanum commersonii]
MIQSFKVLESNAMLTLTKMNIMHLTQDYKGLFKACNGAESKGMFLKICAMKNHSVQLVGITDTLGNPPFGLVHRLSSFAFGIFTF